MHILIRLRHGWVVEVTLHLSGFLSVFGQRFYRPPRGKQPYVFNLFLIVVRHFMATRKEDLEVTDLSIMIRDFSTLPIMVL